MINTQSQSLTLEDFLKLPETKPASEYINGEIVQKPMPQGKHSKLQGKIVTAINELTESQKIALAFPELRCTFGGRSIVPDVAVFTWQRIPVDENGDVANVFTTAPDWMIEILSPGQSLAKVTRNILHSLTYDCQLGWLIDPDEKLVIAYPAGKQPELFEQANDSLPVPGFLAKLQFKLEDLFNWLKL